MDLEMTTIDIEVNDNNSSTVDKGSAPKANKPRTFVPRKPTSAPPEGGDGVDKDDIDMEASTGFGFVAQVGVRQYQLLNGHDQMVARLAIELASGHVPIMPVHDPCNQIFSILVRQSPLAVQAVMSMSADEREKYVRTQMHVVSNKISAIRAALKTKSKIKH
jgi:hypothetical protein